MGADERRVAAVAEAAAGDAPRARSGLTHCSAAAKARAAWLRPAPGGPVNSHACVMRDASGGGASLAAAVTNASASRAAAASCSLTRSCPTRSSHTVMGQPALPSYPSVASVASVLRRIHCAGPH